MKTYVVLRLKQEDNPIAYAGWDEDKAFETWTKESEQVVSWIERWENGVCLNRNWDKEKENEGLPTMLFGIGGGFAMYAKEYDLILRKSNPKAAEKVKTYVVVSLSEERYPIIYAGEDKRKALELYAKEQEGSKRVMVTM